MLASALLLLTVLSGQSTAQKTGVDTAIARVGPSLVRIHVVMIDHVAGREVKREASGSGTIISPEGYVLTNHHVAGRTRAITCTLASREEIPADLVGTDPLSDLAVLKLHPARPTTYPAAKFGDSSKLKVGDPVLALGSPLALSQSVTMGIVSNIEMILPGMFWPFNRMTLDGEDVGSIVRWIGHDAPIFGGNSGGPLVNMAGEIVGVNEISLGLAGAIPGRSGAGSLGRADPGRPRPPKLDWSRRSTEAQERRLHQRRPRGQHDRGLSRGQGGIRPRRPAGPARRQPGERAVRRGSTALQSDGDAAAPRSAAHRPESHATVQERTLTVVPEERASVEAPVKEIPELGITASNISFWSAKELRRSNQDGVRVRDVRTGGSAAEAKPFLQDDDVILEFDGKPTNTVEALSERLQQVVKGHSETVSALLAFDRAGERMLTVVNVGGSALDDPGREATKAWLPVATQVLSPELAEMLDAKGRSGFRVTRLLGGSANSRAAGRRSHSRRQRRSADRLAAVGCRPPRDHDPPIQDWHRSSARRASRP